MSRGETLGRPTVVVALLTLVFLNLPIIVVVASAFTDGGFIEFPPSDWGTRWIMEPFDNPRLLESASLSLRLAGAVAVIAVFGGVAIGRKVARYSGRRRAFHLSLLSSPALLPSLLVAVSHFQLWVALAQPRSFLTLLGGHLVLAVPYAIRTMTANFQRYSWDLENAAASLGANRWTTFFRVTLPAIRPALIATFAFTALISFDDVVVSLFLVAPGLQTLPVVIFTTLEQNLSPELSVISLFVIMFSTLLIILIERTVGLYEAFAAGDQRRQVGRRRTWTP